MEPTKSSNVAAAGGPFRPGVIVLLTLSDPREKFWGGILALTAQTLSLSGIELGSFDGLVSTIKAGEPASFGVVFFPMQGVERVEIDSSGGNVPSRARRFAINTGLEPASVLARHLTANPETRELK